MSFTFTVTGAGRSAILDAAQAGITLALTSISVGSGSYAPTGEETALAQQQALVAIAESYIDANGQQLDLGAVFSGAESYWIREVGVWASDVLVFVWSDPSAANYLAYKNANVDFLFSCSVALPNMPNGVIQVVDSGQALGLVMGPYNDALASLGAEMARLGLRDAKRLLRGH